MIGSGDCNGERVGFVIGVAGAAGTSENGAGAFGVSLAMLLSVIVESPFVVHLISAL
jgi:hypothetical protein